MLSIVSEIITWWGLLIFSGVIHGDYNEQNLLVAKNNAKSDESPYEEHDIVGVIDFGDMAETCYVYEVMSYALFTPNCKGSFIPRESGGESEKDQRRNGIHEKKFRFRSV